MGTKFREGGYFGDGRDVGFLDSLLWKKLVKMHLVCE